MTSPSNSVVSRAGGCPALFALLAGFASVAVGAGCGTHRGSLRSGTQDPRAGDPVSAGQPAPPPPPITADSDPDNIERRFGHEEGRARRESLQKEPDEPPQEKIVVDATKAPPPPPPRRPGSVPAASRRAGTPDAGATPPAKAAPRR